LISAISPEKSAQRAGDHLDGLADRELRAGAWALGGLAVGRRSTSTLESGIGLCASDEAGGLPGVLDQTQASSVISMLTRT